MKSTSYMTPLPDAESISYEDSKRIAAGKDGEERKRLSSRHDVRPEVLFYLANDPSPEVRRNIAANPHTPAHAGPILARDHDEQVRLELAERVARLTTDLSEPDRGQAQLYVAETLQALAQDQTARVRRILAEALKSDPEAPHAVIQSLAREDDLEIASPVLEFSPLLTDNDLLEIIGEGCVSGKLRAISRRHGLGAEVADAIVASDDEPAITALLSNDSAQVREDTLEQLIERAAGVTAWHRPLVNRPRLSSSAAQKLATFVAHHLVRELQSRGDLDREVARRIGQELHRRLSEPEELEGSASEPDPEATPPDEKALEHAMQLVDLPAVRKGLSLRSNFDEAVVRKILESASAKAVTALVWKADLSMRFAIQLQTRVAKIPPSKVLQARGGTEFPLTPEEMDWQLEFFESLDG